MYTYRRQWPQSHRSESLHILSFILEVLADKSAIFNINVNILRLWHCSHWNRMTWVHNRMHEKIGKEHYACFFLSSISANWPLSLKVEEASWNWRIDPENLGQPCIWGITVYLKGNYIIMNSISFWVWILLLFLIRYCDINLILKVTIVTMLTL